MTSTESDGAPVHAAHATIDALEEMLDAIDARLPDGAPQWEYCEGVLTALLCTRREVHADEWLPMLFGAADEDAFASPGERNRFLMYWLERREQLKQALEASVDTLDDERALEPAVVDLRAAIQALPEQERAEALAAEEALQPLGQAWAAGFLDAVDAWDEDWRLPRDREIARQVQDALACLARLLEPDTGTPAVNLIDEDGEPSVSQERMDDFGEAIWAVYDLYAIARSLGPRSAPVTSEKIGRNDPCPCGSGKKYKKCCGA